MDENNLSFCIVLLGTVLKTMSTIGTNVRFDWCTLRNYKKSKQVGTFIFFTLFILMDTAFRSYLPPIQELYPQDLQLLSQYWTDPT